MARGFCSLFRDTQQDYTYAGSNGQPGHVIHRHRHEHEHQRQYQHHASDSYTCTPCCLGHLTVSAEAVPVAGMPVHGSVSSEDAETQRPLLRCPQSPSPRATESSIGQRVPAVPSVPRPRLQKPYGTVTEQPREVAAVAATAEWEATEKVPAYGAVSCRSSYPSRIGSHDTVFSPRPVASPYTCQSNHPDEEESAVHAATCTPTVTPTVVAHVSEPSQVALLPPAPPSLDADGSESDSESECEDVAICVEELRSPSTETDDDTGAGADTARGDVDAGPRVDVHIRGYDDHAVSTDDEPWSVL